MQSPGQRSWSNASAPPLLRAVPPSSPHDPKGTGGEAVHDASSIQQGESNLKARVWFGVGSKPDRHKS